MFETFLAAPFHFTIEFVGFVVCAGAVFLVPARHNLVPSPVGSRAVAVGFAALAVASVLHGAAFVEAEGDRILLALRTFGMLSVLAGIIGGATLAASAVAVVDDRFLYAPAGAALLVAIVAAVRSRHSGLDPLRRLAFAALLLGAGEALMARVPNESFDPAGTEAIAWAAHGLRLIGYLAVLSWLWAGVRASMRSRFVAAYAGLLVVVVLALSTTLTGVISANVEREELGRVSTQLGSAESSIADQENGISRFVRLIATADAVRAGVAAEANLDRLAANFTQSEAFPLDVVVFTSPQGRLLASAGDGPVLVGDGDEPRQQPLQRADVLAILGSPVLVESVVAGGRELAVSIDRIDDDTLVVLAAAEVLDPEVPRRRAGIIAAGTYLDSLFVDEISSDFRPASATLFVGGGVVATDLPATVAEIVSLPPEARAETAPGAPTTVKQVIGDRSFLSAFAPLEAEAGEPVLALSSPAEIVATTRRDVIRSLFLVALGVGAVALLLAWLSGRRITRPIQEFTSTARAVREGDLSARARVSGDDEVGQLGETFNQMTTSLVSMTREERDLRGRIETIIQSMADGLVAVDAEKKVLAFNIEAELLTGIGAERAIGRPVGEVLQVGDAQGRRVSLPIHSLTEGAVSGVYMARRRGAPVPVAVTSAVLRGDTDEVAGGVAVIRDMTREHEIEKMKGDFLSNISHELRTPLTPIKGYAEMLAGKDVPPDRAHTFARGIVDATARLERIVALLIDFSAMEAGRLAPRSGSVDMASLVKSLADEWGRRSVRHEVVAVVADDLPKVSGDERLLKRSLEEVLDNAVKFSPRGGRIRLEARGVSSNGADGPAAVQVAVSDEGIGIPREDLSTIFSDFHQVDASETRSYGGLGLGLAFVQRIVQAHRGDVAVESEPDRGTRLTITIPAAGG